MDDEEVVFGLLKLTWWSKPKFSSDFAFRTTTFVPPQNLTFSDCKIAPINQKKLLHFRARACIYQQIYSWSCFRIFSNNCSGNSIFNRSCSVIFEVVAHSSAHSPSFISSKVPFFLVFLVLSSSCSTPVGGTSFNQRLATHHKLTLSCSHKAFWKPLASRGSQG